MKILDLFMSPKDIEPYKRYAALVHKVAYYCNDERASKCGYDILMGLSKGDAEDRCKAWYRYLDEVRDGKSHVDSERDGVWVPAVML